MSERVDLQEFIGGFVAEADELIALANTQLLEIETGNAEGVVRVKAVRDLFRGLHTIKGLAGMIGVEPIVEIAHELETLLRKADKAGGRLGGAGVEVCLLGVRAIAERVLAVADGTPVAPALPALLEEIANADIASAALPAAAPPLVPGWEAKLGDGEQQQVAEAMRAGIGVWSVTFAPSEAFAAAGTTIAVVRTQVAALGELIKVMPRAQAGAVMFELLVASRAEPAAIAAAGATTLERVRRIEAPAPVATPATGAGARADHAPPTSELEEVRTIAAGRAVVRVELSRLDDLQDLLSTLVVSRFRLERELARAAERGTDVRRLREVAEQQGRQLRDLRRAILRARMVRVGEVLEPLQLVVRSLVRPTIKEARLVLDARESEIDKAVADRILPAIVHLVRNAVDHAIEPVEERLAAGKPRAGTVRITCADIGSRLELAVVDDGRGIDRAAIARRANRPIADDTELLDVLTASGFSTRDVVSQTSGRGLGMDIVRRVIVNELGGDLSVSSTLGAGTTFRMHVPLTIAIVDVFSFLCGGQAFVTPVATIEEIIELSEFGAMQPPVRAGTQPAVGLVERRGRPLSLVSLGQLLALDAGTAARKALVIRRQGELLAFTVDRVLGRQEVVVRPLEDALARLPGIAGATDLGDGKPTLVLDLAELGAGIARRGATA